MREVWPGKPLPPRRDLRRRRRQLRGLLAGRDPRRGLPLRPGRPRARDRPLRSSRDRPSSSGTATCRAWSRARSTACACTAPTSPRAGPPLQPEQAAGGSLRQGALRRGRLDAARASATRPGDEDQDLTLDERDSAAGVPKSVVVERLLRLGRRPRARTSLARDDHLRGARARLHQAAPRGARARCAAPTRASPTPPPSSTSRSWASPRSSCCPVHEVADDGFLRGPGAAQLLGLQHARLLRARAALRRAARTPGAQVAEFKAMVKALHAAGIEVILDVVYNHTCEGNHLGPDAVAARASTTPPTTG